MWMWRRPRFWKRRAQTGQATAEGAASDEGEVGVGVEGAMDSSLGGGSGEAGVEKESSASAWWGEEEASVSSGEVEPSRGGREEIMGEWWSTACENIEDERKMGRKSLCL